MFELILMFYNAMLFIWCMIAAIMWISEHEGKISSYFMPPIFLLISLASCLFSLWVYNNFGFG